MYETLRELMETAPPKRGVSPSRESWFESMPGSQHAPMALIFVCLIGTIFAAQAKSAKPQISSDPQDPAYWGLKPGEYIPGQNCFAWSLGRKKFGLEICTKITYLYVKE